MDVTTVDKGKLALIKRIVISEAGELGVQVDSVILFGSRSRGMLEWTVTGIYWLLLKKS